MQYLCFWRNAAAIALFLLSPSVALCQPSELTAADRAGEDRSSAETEQLISRGRYLATIGVCEACHTPPAVPADPATNETLEELQLRSDPNWFGYLDNERRMAGGVPFIIRIDSNTSAFVSTSNITSDHETGIGNWTEDQIVDVLRSGRRPGGGALFRFAPHTFYENMAENDARAIAVYLKSLPPIRNLVAPRVLPFPVAPSEDVTDMEEAPFGRTMRRAEYLLEAVVGCKECHSYTDPDRGLIPYVGGDPIDPHIGVFRLGPDLPLRESEKGFAAFPYPGYAILYGGNLTRFGLGGDLAHISAAEIAEAIRSGISTQEVEGRPQPLAHVMMWQFYQHMTEDDVMALAEYLKALRYQEHDIGKRLRYFGDDWARAFEAVFGEKPSEHDRMIFGKTD